MKTQTNAILREIGKDARKGIARAGKGLAQIVCKASYPILGNLSKNLQDRLGLLVGHEYYNPEDASITAGISNFAVYPYLSNLLLHGNSATNIEDTITYGIVYALVEGAFRTGIGISRSNKRNSWRYTEEPQKSILKILACKGRYDTSAVGSLPGKIISLPLDLATYAYDYVSNRAKNYLNDVKRRAKEQI